MNGGHITTLAGFYPDTPETRAVLQKHADQMGFVLHRTGIKGVWCWFEMPGASTPPAAPPIEQPPQNWWDDLKPGDLVKLNQINVPVFFDPAETAQTWNTLSDWRTMTVVDLGIRGEWIPVMKFPPFNLWVQARYVVRA